MYIKIVSLKQRIVLRMQPKIIFATRNSKHVKKLTHLGSVLGAALEQLTVKGWKSIEFTSRFLSSCEERYSANELEIRGCSLVY